MKRLLPLLLVILLILVGCSQSKTENAGELRCTMSISCKTLVGNEVLTEAKRSLVPEDGWLFEPADVAIVEGESAFDVLQRVTRENRIHLEYVKTPAYNSMYIEGIGNLYEFDGGPKSGWVFTVNGEFPNYSSSGVVLKDGDVVEWKYTCDLGEDVGRSIDDEA